MTTTTTAAPPTQARSRTRLALETAAAGLVGLFALAPLWDLALGPAATGRPGVTILTAVLDATLAAVAWLRYRGPDPHPVLVVLGRRWPAWVGLACTADNWADGSLPDPWVLLVLPAGYLLIGGLRGRLRDRRALLVQLAGLAGYLVLIAVAVTSSPLVASSLVVAGWGVHALWDAAHLRAGSHGSAGAVVPRGYAEWCGVVDAVIAIAGALFLSGLASTR